MQLLHKILYMQPIELENNKVIINCLAKIIREERIKQNKSQRLLADEYELQRSLLSRIEKGQNEPKLISLLKIGEALGLSPSKLFLKLEEQLPKGFSLIDK